MNARMFGYFGLLLATTTAAFFIGGITRENNPRDTSPPASSDPPSPKEGTPLAPAAQLRSPLLPKSDGESAKQIEDLLSKLAEQGERIALLESELKRINAERGLYRSQCKSQLSVQFIEEYAGRLEASDISLVLGQVVEMLEFIPSDDQITQFLSKHEEYMHERAKVDKDWFAIKGDSSHPDAQAIMARRKEVGDHWRSGLESVFGLDGARMILGTD